MRESSNLNWKLNQKLIKLKDTILETTSHVQKNWHTKILPNILGKVRTDQIYITQAEICSLQYPLSGMQRTLYGYGSHSGIWSRFIRNCNEIKVPEVEKFSHACSFKLSNKNMNSDLTSQLLSQIKISLLSMEYTLVRQLRHWNTREIANYQHFALLLV